MLDAPDTSLAARIQHRVESDNFRLPVFNPVALKIQKLLEEHADMGRVEQLILKDAGLAAEVLRVANSAFFSGLAPSSSLRQALVRLGSEQVLSVTMMAAQEQAFQAKQPVLATRMKSLWLHSMISAVASRWLAERCEMRDLRETAFLAGLLHDVGSLVVVKVMQELHEAGQTPDITDALITELIDTLHTNFGFQVLLAWDLPEVFSEIARDHELETCPNGTALMAVTRLVDAACRLLGVGQSQDPSVALETLPEAQRLGLKGVQLAELELLIEDTAHKAGCRTVGRIEGG